MTLGVPGMCDIETMTNEKCQQEIIGRGKDLNPMKGIPGNFYRENRKEDLKRLVLEILGKKYE